MSEFGKVEVTSTPAESSFFNAIVLLKLDFNVTYIPNLDKLQKILSEAYQRIF
jgi:hypothetical protein